MGHRKDGIRSAADLRARCFIEEECGCWRYRLQVNAAGSAEVTLRIDGRKTKMHGRRASLILAGVRIPLGHEVFAKSLCTYDDCVNPQHSRSGTRKERNQQIAEMGLVEPERAAHLAKFNESRRKLNEEQRRDVRLSTESATAAAARLGVSESLVFQIRRGTRTTPANSVFQWGDRA